MDATGVSGRGVILQGQERGKEGEPQEGQDRKNPLTHLFKAGDKL